VAILSTVSTERLAKIIVEVADTMVDEFDLIEIVQMLANPGRRSGRRLDRRPPAG
jgi:hypothetical protein